MTSGIGKIVGFSITQALDMRQVMHHTDGVMHQSKRWPRAKRAASLPTPTNYKLLRLARQIAGWSQQDLAERAGVDIGLISRLERGLRGRRTSYETLVRIARALHVDVEELFPVADVATKGDAA